MCGPLKQNDIGDERVRLPQAGVDVRGHRRLAVPAEGLQRFGDEGFGLRRVRGPPSRSARAIISETAAREDRAACQDLGGLAAQGLVGDEVEAQERGKDAERDCVGAPPCPPGERRWNAPARRPRRGRNSRPAPWPSPQTAVVGSRAPARFPRGWRHAVRGRVVPISSFSRSRRSRTASLRPLVEVHVAHQRHERAVLRDLGAVHVRHRSREARPAPRRATRLSWSCSCLFLQLPEGGTQVIGGLRAPSWWI